MSAPRERPSAPPARPRPHHGRTPHPPPCLRADEAEDRGERLLRGLPRGESAFLCPDARSAAKIVSNALYEHHRHSELSSHPLCANPAEVSTEAVDALPADERAALATYVESHAALLHIVGGGMRGVGLLAEVRAQPAWAELQALLAIISEARCRDEAFFLPLRDLGAFEIELRRAAPGVNAIYQALHPVRTRKLGTAVGALEVM